jgi:hypothetical protein
MITLAYIYDQVFISKHRESSVFSHGPEFDALVRQVMKLLRSGVPTENIMEGLTSVEVAS